MILFDYIASFIVPLVEPVDHPFSTSQEVVEQRKDVTEEDNEQTGVKRSTWGSSKTFVKIDRWLDEHTVGSWEIPESSDVVGTDELDIFDKEVISEKNIDVVKYRELKPFVLSPANLTYSDIADSIERSKSYVEKIGRHIKEANRRRNTPLPQ